MLITDVAFSKLNSSHDRQSFRCGNTTLDTYLKKQASQDMRKHIATTYVIHPSASNNIIGYYSLSSTIIELQGLPDLLIKKLPKYPLVPATLIGRLAIDKKHQKQGLGAIVLYNALQRSYDASQNIASFAGPLLRSARPAATCV